MRWGVLSTARIAHSLLNAGADVVAVGSRSPERAAAFARAAGIPRAHGSYDALLADPDVDIVYNPLPNALHVPWTIRALEAGKHVLCEKPLAARAADAARAFDVAQARGLVLAEALMWRHHPQAARARELVAEGAIGHLRLVRGAFAFPLQRSGDVRLSTALEGGSLLDLGCYAVSGARLLTAAEPVEAAATAVLGGDGVDVLFAGTLRFPGDVLGTVEAGLVLERQSALVAVGDEGELRVLDPWHAYAPVLELRRGDEVTREELPAVNHYAVQVTAMQDAVAGRRASPFGRDDALAQARALEALAEAARTGRTVAVVRGA